jgi:hypothetical protein
MNILPLEAVHLCILSFDTISNINMTRMQTPEVGAILTYPNVSTALKSCVVIDLSKKEKLFSQLFCRMQNGNMAAA